MPKNLKFNPFGLFGIVLILIVFGITFFLKSGIYLWYFIASLTIFALVMIIVVSSQEYYQRKKKEEQSPPPGAPQPPLPNQPPAPVQPQPPAPAQPPVQAQSQASAQSSAAVQPQAPAQPPAAVQPQAPAPTPAQLPVQPLQEWDEDGRDYEAALSILWRIKIGSYSTFVILIVNLCLVLLWLRIQDIPIILGFFVASIASGMAIPFLLFKQRE